MTDPTKNRKLGSMLATIAPASTCPSSCPLRGRGCYAENFPLVRHWRRAAKAPTSWGVFLAQVKALPKGSLWRWGQAGDLPGKGERLDVRAFREIVDVNRGRRGFAYTRKHPSPAKVRDFKEANRRGFTVNLSTVNVDEADKRAKHELPLVTVLPHDESRRTLKTPAGQTVRVCPQQFEPSVTCMSCQWCATPKRRFVVGFLAHGTRRQKVSILAKGGSTK